ncbi:MAG TPA: IS630 family transposase [Ktedonosporobacter sp.]|nr:IS630 family transposase [Ktedonosporobacter sp.]
MARCGGVFDRRAELEECLQRGPQPVAAGQPAPPRWTLARIGAALPWLTDYSLSGIWKVLRGSGLRLRSARVQAYSPDPDYQQKVEHLCTVLRQASEAPEEQVVVFVDQMGYGRWPAAATDWMPEAPEPVRVAERFGSNERKWRLMGALNAQTGQVDTLDNYIVGRKQVIQFFQRLDALYPQAKRIWVVLDNWSIHRHEQVQEALAALPRLSLVWLPTYAPWLNPIEKFWRWVRQDVLYLHRDAADWQAVQDHLHAFLAQFATSSPAVLKYVGLLGNGRLAQARRGA